MNWFSAAATGFGLGLAFFGGLWLTVQQWTRSPQWGILIGVSRLLRLILAGATFYALSREGAVFVLAGLGGLWLARGCLIRKV